MALLSTYTDFLRRVDELGYLSLSPLLPGMPSLAEETRGESWHTGDPETDPWQWKDRAAAEKCAAYGCILNGSKGFIGRRCYALFFTACRPAREMPERWAAGEVKPATWELWKLFEKKTLLNTSDVRREMGVSLQSGASRIDAGLKELQAQFYITVAGARKKIAKDGQPYGWPASVYERVETWAPPEWLPQPAVPLDRIVACEMLLDLGVGMGRSVEREALARKLGFVSG